MGLAGWPTINVWVLVRKNKRSILICSYDCVQSCVIGRVSRHDEIKVGWRWKSVATGESKKEAGSARDNERKVGGRPKSCKGE